MPILCVIVTQEKTVFKGDVDYISLPGAEGRMGVLPNHSPLLTSLGFGEVLVREGGNETYFAIGGGFAEVQPDHVTVLADTAESVDEIDIERAEEARKRAAKLVKEGVPEDPERYHQIQLALRRAEIRIDVAQRRGGRRRTQLTSLADDED